MNRRQFLRGLLIVSVAPAAVVSAFSPKREKVRMSVSHMTEGFTGKSVDFKKLHKGFAGMEDPLKAYCKSDGYKWPVKQDLTVMGPADPPGRPKMGWYFYNTKGRGFILSPDKMTPEEVVKFAKEHRLLEEPFAMYSESWKEIEKKRIEEIDSKS